MIDCDVVVVGSGPAGTCAAAALAASGRMVVLLEGKRFPRPHIGESLLAVSIPLLKEFGVLKTVESAAFVRKLGSVFVWGHGRPAVPLPMPFPSYAYQVPRDRFDALLATHSVSMGAKWLQEAWAERLVFDHAGRVAGVQARLRNGDPIHLRARFIIDASGLRRFGAGELGYSVSRDGPARLALGTYYRNARRYPAPNGGDVITEASENGWFWFIPLSDDLTSVGWVTDLDFLQGREIGRAFAVEVETTRIIRELVRDATITSGPTRLRYEHAIVNEPLWANRLILVGDAAGFVDPLFSTGVHSALYASQKAAAAIAAVLAGTVDEHDAARWYDDEVRRHIVRIGTSVRLIYSLHPGNSTFWRRRDLSGLTDVEAEELAVRLGAEGFQFFAQLHQATDHLRLPPPIAKLIPSFSSQPKVTMATEDKVYKMVEGMIISAGHCIREGALRPAITLRHVAGRRQRVSVPVGTAQAHFVEHLNGVKNVGEILSLLDLDINERERTRLFAGTLAQAGLIA